MSFRLTILGTSSALPTSDRFPTAHVLNVHERLFLIDCGEGTQMQMRRYKIRFGKINHIFISHLHGDHLFGLYGLLSTFNLTGRKLPLNIYAPAPFEDLIRRHLADFDIHLGYELSISTLTGRSMKKILSDRRVEVFSFPLKHRVQAYGFLFREKQADPKVVREVVASHRLSIAEIASLKKGIDVVRADGTVIACSDATVAPPAPRSYAYCSDTSHFSKLSDYVRGVSLLYHEATFTDDLAALARETGHSTARQAATVALEAGAERLIIGHFSARYRSPEPLENEARLCFERSEAAREGMSYDI